MAIHARKNFIGAVCMILLLPFFVVGLVSIGAPIVYGQLSPGATGIFGGQITGVFECTCSGSHLIWVGPPVGGGPFHFGPWSIPYEYFQFRRPGAWVLGDLTPPTTCLFGPKCIPFSPQANIRLIGSSQ